MTPDGKYLYAALEGATSSDLVRDASRACVRVNVKRPSANAALNNASRALRPYLATVGPVSLGRVSGGTRQDAILAGIGEAVAQLHAALADAEAQWAEQIARVDEQHTASAVNLAHYWAMRQYDLRGLQQRLAAFGLSSLGRSEPHVQATLDTITTAVNALRRQTAAPARRPVVGFRERVTGSA